MSAPRAGDWHLLGHDSDPVPASPSEVSSEGTHYTTVASTIADQITRLEALAADDAALKGHYAEKLREAATTSPTTSARSRAASAAPAALSRTGATTSCRPGSTPLRRCATPRTPSGRWTPTRLTR